MNKSTWWSWVTSNACRRSPRGTSAQSDRPAVTVLEPRDLPVSAFLTVGDEADAVTMPQVKVYDGTGNARSSFLANDPSFTGEVLVATGDRDGDGRIEVVTAPGAGGPPQSPAIISVSGPSAGTYRAGQVLTYTVTYSGPVIATGSPRIKVDIAMHAGGPLGPDFLQRVYAVYAGGSGTNILTFRYTVRSGDGGPPNPYSPFQGSAGVAGPIDLNGGSIVDSAGAPASVAFALPDSTGVRVDGHAVRPPT